jgi:dimethylamine monooxygenase subunit A
MLPSTWNPLEKIGLPLASIHKPVPNSDALQRASANLTRAVLERGPFERFVWTVQSSPQLGAHTARTMPDDGGAYWRIERQTFVPMPELGRYWFVIRVHVAPLASVLNPDRARDLQRALGVIASSLTQHKRLGALLPRIAATLEPFLTGHHA